MPCNSCPFNDGLTEEATQVQNYGCLPSSHDILDYKDKFNVNWRCHGNDNVVCKGLAAVRDYSSGTDVWYSDWYAGKHPELL